MAKLDSSKFCRSHPLARTGSPSLRPGNSCASAPPRPGIGVLVRLIYLLVSGVLSDVLAGKPMALKV